MAWLALVQSIGELIVGLIPRWILSLAYPTKNLRERVQILAYGVGPHMWVTSGNPLAIDETPIAVHSALPFNIEFEQFQDLTITLESRMILTAKFDKSVRKTVLKRAITRLAIPEYGLSDNQAAIIRQYPSECPTLRVNGKAHFKAPFRTFSLEFSLETRAFRYETPRLARVHPGA